MADNETTSDIIAEMRQGMNPNGTAECQYLESDICMLANRLEAAHKRERGDCAKLREAAEFVAHIDDNGYTSHDVQCAIDKARAALKTPPRNCDLAQDWIRGIYAHFQPPASVKREMPPEWVDAVMAFCRWLVAPATEKEGGSNADK